VDERPRGAAPIRRPKAAVPRRRGTSIVKLRNARISFARGSSGLRPVLLTPAGAARELLENDRHFPYIPSWVWVQQ